MIFRPRKLHHKRLVIGIDDLFGGSAGPKQRSNCHVIAFIGELLMQRHCVAKVEIADEVSGKHGQLDHSHDAARANSWRTQTRLAIGEMLTRSATKSNCVKSVTIVQRDVSPRC
jgi:hypothetical protein